MYTSTKYVVIRSSGLIGRGVGCSLTLMQEWDKQQALNATRDNGMEGSCPVEGSKFMLLRTPPPDPTRRLLWKFLPLLQLLTQLFNYIQCGNANEKLKFLSKFYTFCGSLQARTMGGGRMVFPIAEDWWLRSTFLQFFKIIQAATLGGVMS